MLNNKNVGIKEIRVKKIVIIINKKKKKKMKIRGGSINKKKQIQKDFRQEHYIQSQQTEKSNKYPKNNKKRGVVRATQRAQGIFPRCLVQTLEVTGLGMIQFQGDNPV